MIETMKRLFRNSSRTSGQVFITDPRCPVGKRVFDRLLKVGNVKVRVGTENHSTAIGFDHLMAEEAFFSWEDESTYSSALQGISVVFCVIPHHQDWATHFPRFFKACRLAGVQHFVKLSFYHALTATRARVMKGFHVALPDDNPFRDVPFIKQQGDCDELVIKNHMDYTILSVTHLMSDPLVYQGRNLTSASSPCFYGASHNQGVNYVSPNDVAAAATHILVNPRAHRRVGYTLTGPSPISDSTVASLLSKYTRIPVEYRDMSWKQFEEEEKKEGDPDWLIQDLVPMEKLKASGLENNFTSKDYQRLCGRKAESLETYLNTADQMTEQERMVLCH